MDDTKSAAIATDGGLKKQLDDSAVLLGSVRSSLADLLQEVRSGNGRALKDIAVKASELESALKRAFEAEQRYHEWKNRQTGPDQGRAGDIDFDAVRRDIGCRLHRLRTCCQSD